MDSRWKTRFVIPNFSKILFFYFKKEVFFLFCTAYLLFFFLNSETSLNFSFLISEFF